MICNVRAMLCLFSIILLGAGLTGCAPVSAVANAMPESKNAAYSGLAGQSIAVMVWADRGIRIDWPSIQLDLANVVQNKIRGSGAPEIKDSTFPVPPASIVKYQRDYPATESMPITETAPKFGASRLIYIELTSFSTRSAASLQMFRGNATAMVRVMEVSGNQAVVGYEESNIKAFYPPKSPPDGVLNSDDTIIYRGTIAALGEEIAHRLTTHEVERSLSDDMTK